MTGTYGLFPMVHCGAIWSYELEIKSSLHDFLPAKGFPLNLYGLSHRAGSLKKSKGSAASALFMEFDNLPLHLERGGQCERALSLV